MTPDGHWRMDHDDLEALLARSDLSWEPARVYLALGDLTLGYGKTRDVVSIGQIAERAGMSRPHVVRAFKRLGEKGLYGQAAANGQKVVRWVVWPAPKPAEGVAVAGNRKPASVAKAGNGSGVAKGVAKGVARAGNHQDSNTPRKKRRRKAASPAKPNRTKAPQAPTSDHKAFVDWFSGVYLDVFGLKYDFEGGKDGKHVKTLLGKYGLAQLQAMTQAMLADPWGRDAASIGVLCSQRNKWARKAVGVDASADPQAERNRQELEKEQQELAEQRAGGAADE